ncbi:proteasome accessory factor PafA2 family protein [Nonomuraea rubra]|uniref:proteasome accessory factor PafA2 family protein n=1 Tax=Nonomuraea rubra TaxID=46180 RepID=UPI003CD085ED
MSQRAEHIWEACPSLTTPVPRSSTPGTNRHGDASGFRRLHGVVGDANMSQTTSCSRAPTDLVLRMVRGRRRDAERKNHETW